VAAADESGGCEVSKRELLEKFWSLVISVILVLAFVGLTPILYELLLIVVHANSDADAREPIIRTASMGIGGGTDLQRWGAMDSPGPWPDFLDPDSDIWHTPDGRIDRRYAWFNEDHWEYGVEVYYNGSDSQGAARRTRVIERWYPSPLNRSYDPCNYAEEINAGLPGYPGDCPPLALRPVRSLYR